MTKEEYYRFSQNVKILAKEIPNIIENEDDAYVIIAYLMKMLDEIKARELLLKVNKENLDIDISKEELEAYLYKKTYNNIIMNKIKNFQEKNSNIDIWESQD